MLKIIKQISIVALSLFLSGIAMANASEYKKGSIIVENPWVRASHSGANSIGGYAHIINKGDKDEYLVSVISPISKKIQLHEMSMKNNVMVMRHLRKPILIKAHSEFIFKPGSYHIMFMKLPKPVAKGDVFPAKFCFRDIGSIDVKFVAGSDAAVEAPKS